MPLAASWSFRLSGQTVFRRCLLLATGPALLLAYLVLGAVSLSITEILQITGLVLVGDFSTAEALYPQTSAILLHIRLPRAVAAIFSGCCLALAGAAMQGLFRNPLASPDILGISAGSGLGAVIAIATGLATVHPLATPAFSVLGALCTAIIVYLLALRQAIQQMLFLILAGLALSSLLSGATSATLLMAKQYQVSQFVFWTMGGLEGRLWQHVLWPAPLVLVLSLITMRYRQALNLLALGEENAHGMGLDVARTRHMILLCCAVLTALAISIAGPIAFIGLMVPHLVRLLLGSDHRRLLPWSAYIGVLFVLAADLLGRWAIAPHEIKVGVITAIIGGSYFVYLIFRIQQRGQIP